MSDTIAEAGGRGAVPRPTAIGPYLVLSELGEGTFGRVYLAEDSRLERTVALKVLKPLRSDDDLQQIQGQFRVEQAALSLMSSDYIAKLYETGEVDGRPFFALEYVEGEPLTSFCDARRLSLAERLALFSRLCAGVQHAHQRGVIHRDLKPGNVLTSEVDGVPVPKIIDFGVARGRDRLLFAEQLPTQPGLVMGTPVYMSPEQAQGMPVDTRTDVHALGMILYELLCGSLPVDGPNVTSPVAAVRPSARLSALLAAAPERAEAQARARGMTAPQLLGMLIGDLDWIVLKATAEEPDKRYATPGSLAEDLQCYALHLPVTARPPSRAYRLKKFVRRHRWPVLLATAVALLLVSVAVGASVALAEARGRQRANARTLFQAGEFAADRGDFVTALDSYARAEASEYPDRIELAIRRVEALDGARRYAEATGILEALVVDPALGERAAKVQILLADLGFDRLLDPDRNLACATRALELAAAQPGVLTAADAAYANALLAQTAPDALTFLRQARQADPRHRRTNDCLGVTLLLLGHFEEARTFAQIVQTLYPDDPQSLFLALCVAGMADEADVVEALVVRVQRKFGADEAELARLIADLCMLRPWGNRVLREMATDSGTSPAMVLLKVLAHLQPLWRRLEDVMPFAGQAVLGEAFVRIPPAVVRVYQPVWTAVRGDSDKALSPARFVDALAAARAVAQEATVPYLYALGCAALGRYPEAAVELRHALSLRTGIIERRTMLLSAILIGTVIMIEKRLESADEIALVDDLRGWVAEAAGRVELEAADMFIMHSAADKVRSDRLLEIIARWQRLAPDDDRARLAYAEYLAAVGAGARALQIAEPISARSEQPAWLQNWADAVIRAARK